MYNEQELAVIRDTISGKRVYTPEEIDLLNQKWIAEDHSRYLGPLHGLFVVERDLYDKVSNDPLVRNFAHIGFFPEIYPLVYESDTLPTLKFAQGNRGLVVLADHPQKRMAIKLFQNCREREVAQIASELGVGPRQYPSLDGYLTEELLEGELFSLLPFERRSPEQMYTLGRRMGEILTLLHSRNIFYNDTILSDDFARSHVFVPKNKPACLFDYGVALRLDHYPDLSDEEVWNYTRTLPLVNMFMGFGVVDESRKRELIQESRVAFETQTKEEIMARDVSFIIEGLGFASLRLGHNIVEPFQKGFSETYI
ncbi:hypothetical protein EXS74_01030 [Candidatus Woesearchaeota archaeon]|nr:hypothetical protein [Candidatus Woesearchaeota archaeon]